jgi:hypothetical protein
METEGVFHKVEILALVETLATATLAMKQEETVSIQLLHPVMMVFTAL